MNAKAWKQYTEKRNKARAFIGVRALGVVPDHEQQDTETNLIDLLADLRHFAHQTNLDFAKCLTFSEDHFLAEINGEE